MRIAGLPDADPWPGESRDAGLYAGPWAVVAYPPCSRGGQVRHQGPSRRLAPHPRR